MITPEQIYEHLYKEFGLPCLQAKSGTHFRNIINKDGWCDEHCDDGGPMYECWKRYFEVTLGENSNEDSKVSRKENRS